MLVLSLKLSENPEKKKKRRTSREFREHTLCGFSKRIIKSLFENCSEK